MNKNTKKLYKKLDEKLCKNVEKAINIFGTEEDKQLLKNTKEESENGENEYGRPKK